MSASDAGRGKVREWVKGRESRCGERKESLGVGESLFWVSASFALDHQIIVIVYKKGKYKKVTRCEVVQLSVSFWSRVKVEKLKKMVGRGGKMEDGIKKMTPPPHFSIALLFYSFRIQVLIVSVLFPSLVNCKSIFVANQVHPIYSFQLSAFNLHPYPLSPSLLMLSLLLHPYVHSHPYPPLLMLLFYPFLIRNELSSFPYDYCLAIKMNSSLCKEGCRQVQEAGNNKWQ